MALRLDTGVPPVYARFFIENIDSRHVLLQGSRRSGKTWAVFRWLVFLASGINPIDVMVVCASFPALQNTIQDFTESTGYIVEGSQLYGYNAKVGRSMFKFKSFDSAQKAQGTHCTHLFINEALNIEEAIITTLTLGASKQIFADFNPTRKQAWLDSWIMPDRCNILRTTYKDNTYLPTQQVAEFERLTERGTAPNASILDRFVYKTYVLGEFGDLAGKVFMNVTECTPEHYNGLRDPEIYGMDFGFVDGKDITALVGCKVHDGILYARQIIYSNALTSDRDLAITMRDRGMTPYDTIAADYGGMGRTRMNNLITAGNGEWTEEGIQKGFTICNAVKGSVIDGIHTMLQYKEICVTGDSVQLRMELDGYELNDGGKPVGSDHALDALRYAVSTGKASGMLVSEKTDNTR